MSKHITNINISQFRGLTELEISTLSDINIIVGDNNSGKTSVLEAIQLFCDPSEYQLLLVAKQREMFRTIFRSRLPNTDALSYLFNINQQKNSTDHSKITLSGTIVSKEQHVTISGKKEIALVNIEELTSENSAIKHKFKDQILDAQTELPVFMGEINTTLSSVNKKTKFEINEFTRLFRTKKENTLRVSSVQTIDHILKNSFNNLIKNKQSKDEAIALLKEFDSAIQDLLIINYDGERDFTPVIDNGGDNYLPLSLYGDGIKKVLTVLDAILKSEDGVLLIDEFETALHTSAMAKVFSFILKVAQKMNVQLFLTTHSEEALDKILTCEPELTKKIQVIRLKQSKKGIFAKITEGEEAVQLREDYNMELRV